MYHFHSNQQKCTSTSKKNLDVKSLLRRNTFPKDFIFTWGSRHNFSLSAFEYVFDLSLLFLYRTLHAVHFVTRHERTIDCLIHKGTQEFMVLAPESHNCRYLTISNIYIFFFLSLYRYWFVDSNSKIPFHINVRHPFLKKENYSIHTVLTRRCLNSWNADCTKKCMYFKVKLEWGLQYSANRTWTGW